MGWLSDALRFETSHVSDLWSGIKKDPKRLVLGMDPASTWAWNKVLGRDDQPLVNQLGGPTEQNYENAEARGIDTGAGRTLHGIAGTIAGAYGGQAAGGALSWAGGGTGGGNWAQYAKLAQGAMSQPSGAAPVAGSPPINDPRTARTGPMSTSMPNAAPGPVSTGNPGLDQRRRQMLSRVLMGAR